MTDGFTGILRNTYTGEMHKIDSRAARLGRMRRRIHAWSEVCKEITEKIPTEKKMVTLTYQSIDGWQANHIRDFMNWVKRNFKEELLAYAWVAEMQKRGAVHYHVYLIVKKGVHIPMPDKAGIWPYGMTQVASGKSPFYLVAYLKKTGKEKSYQKENFFKGMRIFAVWVRKDLIRVWSWTQFRWSSLPAWLKIELEKFGIVMIGLFPKRKEGGGWYVMLPKDRRDLIRWPVPEITFESPWVLD